MHVTYCKVKAEDGLYIITFITICYLSVRDGTDFGQRLQSDLDSRQHADSPPVALGPQGVGYGKFSWWALIVNATWRENLLACTPSKWVPLYAQ